ncbi:MAG: FISUMP domain-containing protein [Saprospiraceae bacterium]
MSKTQNRRLAAIVFTDIAGYTAMMHKNETAAMVVLDQFKSCLQDLSAIHNGDIVQYYGDAGLLTFNSSVEAMKFCEALQITFKSEPKVPARIGVHLGDIVLTEDNVFGDAVNVASRVESMGVSGAVLFSEAIKKSIKSHPEFKCQSVGIYEFKNVDEPMEIFALANEGFPVPKKEEMKGKLKTPLIDTKNKAPRSFIYLLGLISLIALGWYFSRSVETPMKITPEEGSVLTPIPVEIEDVNQGNIIMGLFDIGSFTDIRDNHPYKWVKYKNGQKWMAQNLNYLTGSAPCYHKKKECNLLGRLYSWQNAQIACPSGWHLPSQEEWEQLLRLAGENEMAYHSLMDEEVSGFVANLGGSMDEKGQYNFINEGGNYWTSNEASPVRGSQVMFSKNIERAMVLTESKKMGFSCRCVENTEKFTGNNAASNSKIEPINSTLLEQKKEMENSQLTTTLNSQPSLKNTITGKISIEVFDKVRNTYIPTKIIAVSTISSDLKLSKKTNGGVTSIIDKMKAQNSYIVEGDAVNGIRVVHEGNAIILNIEERAEGGLVYNILENDQHSSGIDADLKIGIRPRKSMIAQTKILLICEDQNTTEMLRNQLSSTTNQNMNLQNILMNASNNKTDLGLVEGQSAISYNIITSGSTFTAIIIIVR